MTEQVYIGFLASGTEDPVVESETNPHSYLKFIFIFNFMEMEDTHLKISI